MDSQSRPQHSNIGSGALACQVLLRLRFFLPPPWAAVTIFYVTVQLNGEAREVPEGSSVRDLIEFMKLPPDRVAVERNLEIVPRARWNVTPIYAGDRLEVVHLVGGGSSE